MTTDELLAACARLAETDALRDGALAALQELAQSKTYRVWADGVGQAQPFIIDGQTRAVLTRCGLASGQGALAGRINEHVGRLFLTDGVWVDPGRRVFPFCDESAALLAQAHRLGWVQRSHCVVDLAGGSGHTAWALNRPLQWMFDISPRALAFAQLNRVLNSLDPQRYLSSQNDIRQGIPPLGGQARAGDLLFLANMPFGPAPWGGLLPQTSDGGPAGMSLQRSTFEALRQWAAGSPRPGTVRALIMGVSLGCARSDRWMLHDEAAEIFGAHRTRWHLCADPLLRINGRRAMANPSPVEAALPALADCTLYHPEPAWRETARQAWRELARQHTSQGLSDVAYGIVALELN